MEKEQEQAPASAADLEAALGEPVSEFAFTLKSGFRVRARAMNDIQEWTDLQRRAKGMAHALSAPAALKNEKFAQYHPWLPAPKDIIENAYLMSELIIEPTGVTLAKALEWSRTRAILFAEIWAGMDGEVDRSLASKVKEQIDDLKND